MDNKSDSSSQVVREVKGAHDSDDEQLAKLGYKAEFAREFSNLSTISFAFSIMGLCSSITTTFDTPMLYGGGPASVVWCWFIGACFCFTLGTSIAELVSAYPTSGGLYSASAYVVPKRYRASVGWLVGWLNLLGQVAGVASTEFGLSRMIWAAIVIYNDGNYEVTSGKIVGLYVALLVLHGLINSLTTKALAGLTKFFVFINLGTTFAIIIALGASSRVPKHSGEYVFTHTINDSGWSSDGLAFLFGLLSVQWTMTDYDATAHISEEVRRASIAAPVAIFVAVIGTGLFGWIMNIMLVLKSGDIADLPGTAGLSVATILQKNLGKGGALAIWVFLCLTASFVVITAMQANSRSFFAFSRDQGLPDRGLFGKMTSFKIPIWSVWLVVFLCAILGMLEFASTIAVNAVFSLCAIALDTSYIIPIACKMIFLNHPDVNFVPGPFNLGKGLKMYVVNSIAVAWTSFVVIILALPTYIPITAAVFNYAAPILGAVLLVSGLWYVLHAHKFYKGPRNYTANYSEGGGVINEGHDAEVQDDQMDRKDKEDEVKEKEKVV
ncbi:amino acid transporter [Atractiella rhizophila]|nr:amino acid transporter [Atractiella rhizophila]